MPNELLDKNESEKETKIRFYLERLAQDDEEEDEFSTSLAQLDPRLALQKAIKTNDVTEVKKAAILPMQMNMIRLATEAESESVQYNATAYVLSQSGHGPVQKVDHNMNYANTPIDQLSAVIRSKLETILKYNPGFSIDKLIGQSQHKQDDIIDVSPEDF